VKTALALLVGSATLVAVIVTVCVVGAVLGAINVAVVPELAKLPSDGFTVQVTPVLDAPVTVAVSDCDWEGSKVAVADVRETETGDPRGAFTVRLSDLELLPKALTALMVKVTEPFAVGVPLMRPVEVFNASPGGREPVVNAHIIGVLPEDVRVCAYFVPASAAGKGEAVVMEGGVRGACENAGSERVSTATKDLATQSEAAEARSVGLLPVVMGLLQLGVSGKYARIISHAYDRSKTWQSWWSPEGAKIIDTFIG
jgi:hypothetical protein